MPHTCIELGRLEKIEDLRSVWRNEVSSFSKWLAEEENLALLGKTIGIEDLSLLETESQNGKSHVDFIYKDEEIGSRNLFTPARLGRVNQEMRSRRQQKMVTFLRRKPRLRRATLVWRLQSVFKFTGVIFKKVIR